MKTIQEVLLVTVLIVFLLVVCVGDRFFAQIIRKVLTPTGNLIENFDNHSYTKI